MKKAPFTLIYADEDMIAVNKAAGLLVAADRWDIEAPRLDLLIQKELPQIAPLCQKLYAVHRIDKDTSGILLYALNAEAHRALNTAFQEREIKKRYLEPKNIVQKELRDLFYQKFEEQYGKKYGMRLEEVNIEKR